MGRPLSPALHRAVMGTGGAADVRSCSVAKIGVAALGLFAFISSAGVAYGATDVVILTNGDRLVGEIKGVEKDVLTIETDYSDSDFKIEWEKVASIESTRLFLVETFDGQRLSGSLKPDPAQKMVVQVGTTTVKLADVSLVQPFERSFWARFDVGLDFGYSMTRANSAKQLSLGNNLSYRDEHHADSLFATVFRNSQENAPETQRWEIGNDFRRLLGTRLVHQHHPGLPEHRGARSGSADDHWRRRRAVSDALVIAAPGPRGRPGVDQ